MGVGKWVIRRRPAQRRWALGGQKWNKRRDAGGGRHGGEVPVGRQRPNLLPRLLPNQKKGCIGFFFDMYTYITEKVTGVIATPYVTVSDQ